jgi:hypothetical protein
MLCITLLKNLQNLVSHKMIIIYFLAQLISSRVDTFQTYLSTIILLYVHYEK